MPLSPVIVIPIPDSNAELCRDRIRDIIEVELEYQFMSNYNPYAEVEAVDTERSNPVDMVETSLVNVSLDNMAYSQKSAGGSRTNTVLINVDVFVKQATTQDNRGDSQSRKKCSKLGSMISYILDDPQYKTLGFPLGFIHTTAVQDFEMADAEKYDTQNMSMGRLTYSVTVSENNTLKSAYPVEGADTKNYQGEGTTYGLEYQI